MKEDIDELDEFAELDDDFEVVEDLDDNLDSFDEFSGESLEVDEDMLDVEEPSGKKLTLRESAVYRLETGEYTIWVPEEADTLDEGAEILEGRGSIDNTTMVLDEPCEVWLPEGTTLWSPFGGAKKVPIVLTVDPMSGNLDANFRLTISGANPKKTVKIKIDRRPLKIDPVIGKVKGDGSVVVTGHTLARAGKLPRDNAEHKLELYGQEKSWGIDRKTKRVMVYVITATTPTPTPYTPPATVTPPHALPVPHPMPGIPHIPPTPYTPPYTPPAVAPAAITPSEAIEGIKAGKQYYIKFAIPLLDMLPGLPYSPGIPILPGFKISETL